MMDFYLKWKKKKKGNVWFDDGGKKNWGSAVLKKIDKPHKSVEITTRLRVSYAQYVFDSMDMEKRDVKIVLTCLNKKKKFKIRLENGTLKKNLIRYYVLKIAKKKKWVNKKFKRSF